MPESRHWRPRLTTIMLVRLANQSALLVQLDRNLFDFSCKREWYLVVVVLHAHMGVHARHLTSLSQV